VRKKLLWVLAVAGLTLVMAACSSDLPQNSLAPAGENARQIDDLFEPIFWVAAAVFVLVEGGILWIVIRYRRRKGRERMPSQIHGNSRLEIGWTIAPAVILAVVMVPTVSLIWKLAADPAPDALHVTAQGYQWWWGFQYTDEDMKVDYADAPITVADVMVIPADRQVYLSLSSEGGLIGDPNPDHMVIHSFWVPRLAGKQDVVPGRTNTILLNADEPGTYWGQCAEFCGLQHGRMKFRIVALDAGDWEAWVENEKSPAASPSDPLAKKGEELFLNPLSDGRGACTACHAIGGTDAGGIAGPNLTHFAAPEHQCFGGCNWETTDEEALKAWLRNPDAVKLGSKMPNYNLSEDEIDALVAYLYSLT
jgi:cytochrome c oxidase subunit 2